MLEEARQGEALVMDVGENQAAQKLLYIESYGCAMNFSDSEIVASILQNEGYKTINEVLEADVILINTCAIRDNAELKIWNRLKQLKYLKKTKPHLVVGVLGCMAERLKSKLLDEEQLVDIVVGPDAYRDLPQLIEKVGGGQKAVNALLSREETYAGISPIRLGSNGISAYVSIMRGCDNMCSFCVVPFTRGRERSRDLNSILKECTELAISDYKEITLLGQNVDSYKWTSETGVTINFAQLLEFVALEVPGLRIRFSTSHPKDISDEVLHIIAKYANICNYIHLPVQSGSSRILKLMNRTYDRAWYLNRVEAIRNIIPDCAISTDTITGFCTETEEDHKETVSLMEQVGFTFAYMYKYSERPGTLAARRYQDDVPEEHKARRLDEIIATHQKCAGVSNLADIGKTVEVLIEGNSKKSTNHFSGRNPQNKMVVFPKTETYKPGDLVMVKITDCTKGTLLGQAV